MLNTMPAFPRY